MSSRRSGRTSINRLVMKYQKIILTFVLFAACVTLGMSQSPSGAATVTDDGDNFVLANGIVTATVEKQSGSLTSLKYKGLELLGAGAGRSNGYWSLPGTQLDFGKKRAASITQNSA